MFKAVFEIPFITSWFQKYLDFLCGCLHFFMKFFCYESVHQISKLILQLQFLSVWHSTAEVHIVNNLWTLWSRLSLLCRYNVSISWSSLGLNFQPEIVESIIGPRRNLWKGKIFHLRRFLQKQIRFNWHRSSNQS